MVCVGKLAGCGSLFARTSSLTTESDLSNAGELCVVRERHLMHTSKLNLPIFEPILYLMRDTSIKFELSLNECGDFDVTIGNDFMVLKPEELFHTLRIVMDQREIMREARIGAALYDFSYTMMEFEANNCSN